MTRSVLAAIDASAAARPVLDAAPGVAELTGATVEAVHVRDDSVEAPTLIAAHAGVRLRLLDGPVEPALLDAVAAPEVIAAVLGARATPAGRRPAGRTALRVLEQASKPIVVVPPEAVGPSPRRFRRLLVPLDGTQLSSRPIEQCLGALVVREVELVVLHVFTEATMPRVLDRPRRDLELLAGEFLARHCPQATRIELRTGVVGSQVAALSQDEDADLIVLSWSRDASEGHAAVVRDVLSRATVPVLLLPVDAEPIIGTEVWSGPATSMSSGPSPLPAGAASEENSRVRVALISPPWIPVPPPAYGGTEAVLDTLARGLAVAGHEVLLVTTGDSTCPVERSWVYERARTEVMGSVVVELRHLLHAYDAVDGADVVHDHTVAGPFYAERYSPRPVVTTSHGPFTDEMKALYRSMAGRVAIVAISHHQASTAGDVPIARVIHHGLDATLYPIGAGGGGYLAFLGRMSPTKGVREAIDVAHRAGMSLVIAAKMREQPERAYFEAAIEPLLGADVTYAGEVGGTDKLDLLGGATALVNPLTWDEPFGLCMIEAMACGTPVIATARGAVPEIVDDGRTGFLCADIDEMAAAVSRLGAIDRSACRASVESRFSARRMVAEHVQLYEDVLGGCVAGGCGAELSAA